MTLKQWIFENGRKGVFGFGQGEDRCVGSERHPHYGGAKWSLRAEFGIKFAQPEASNQRHDHGSVFD